MERERARSRTYDAMVRKAQGRHVTGGRTFGYDNVPVGVAALEGQGLRAQRIRSGMKRRTAGSTTGSRGAQRSDGLVGVKYPGVPNGNFKWGHAVLRLSDTANRLNCLTGVKALYRQCPEPPPTPGPVGKFLTGYS